ncbi:hypothetical protein C7R92_05630 [Brevibacillus porteri]|uniref:Uncharacterized protein n=1 Tax=Brevibacillus porteri TaxID=2126350 RepID=A0ABX5FUG2_9BACL|nr:hypothetical protein C7R92_05630 [Brevibacillus porteri]
MSSSRLYPHFVRAVSFQTCDSAFVQLVFSRCFYILLLVIQRSSKKRFSHHRLCFQKNKNRFFPHDSN